MPEINQNEFDEIERRFFEKYGRAFAEWAAVENALKNWFGYAFFSAVGSEMWNFGCNLAITNGIFDSPQSFGGKAAMLQIAFKSGRREKELTEFFEAAYGRVREYEKFRNALAHHLPIWVASKMRMEIQELDDPFGKKKVVLEENLDNAIANFRQMTAILLKSVPPLSDALPEMKARTQAPKLSLAELKLLPKKAGERPPNTKP